MAIDPGVIGLFDICNAALSALFLLVALRSRDRPGRTGFLVVVAGIVVWSLAIGVDKFFFDRTISIAAFNVVFLGGQIAAVGWLLLAIEFTGWRRISGRWIAGFGLPVLAGQLVFWTNPIHHLILRPETTVENATLVPAYGPAFFPTLGAFYALVLVGTALLLWDAVGATGTRRRQDLVLAVAIVPPFLASLVSVLDLAFAPYDVSPFGFLLAEILFAWVLFRLQFLGVVSAGRRRAVEDLPDAVVTLDEADCLVDANDAAETVLGIDEGSVGRPASDVLPSRPALDDLLDGTGADSQEVTLAVDGERRHYRLTASQFDGHGDGGGRVLVFRDVTARWRREAALQERERERDGLRRVLTGMLQNDLRSSLRVIDSHARTLDDRFPDEEEDSAGRILQKVDDLGELRRKVMAVSRLADRRGTETYDLAAVVESVVADARERYPNATFTLEARGPCQVHASDGIELAVENLIENAVEHSSTSPRSSSTPAGTNESDGAGPTVRVTVEENGEGARLVVADDGPGIPETEVEVIERGAETQLHHCTGVGLWLVKLVVDHSRANLSFDADASGTTVTIDFPSPEAAAGASADSSLSLTTAGDRASADRSG